METTGQASNPLNSENASPSGTLRAYLSCCATAKLPKLRALPQRPHPPRGGRCSPARGRDRTRLGHDHSPQLVPGQVDLRVPSRPLAMWVAHSYIRMVPLRESRAHGWAHHDINKVTLAELTDTLVLAATAFPGNASGGSPSPYVSLTDPRIWSGRIFANSGEQ